MTRDGPVGATHDDGGKAVLADEAVKYVQPVLGECGRGAPHNAKIRSIRCAKSCAVSTFAA